MAAIGQSNIEYHKLYRVMRTVGEMMMDRKYQVAQELIPTSYEAFMDMYVDECPVDAASPDDFGSGRRTKRVIRRDKMTMPAERRVGEKVLHAVVFFVPPGGLSSECMKEYLTMSKRDNCHRVIFVTPNKPNPIVKKTVDNINRSDQGIRVQVFEEDDLAVNITKHDLVPRHIPLEDEEVKAVLQAHALEVSQLPRLLATDPVSAYFGLERGRVVQIERKSQSAGVYVTYRQVV